MIINTPPINCTGIFIASLPFIIPRVDYRCVNLQQINDLVAKGVDVYGLYYAPNGLSEALYQSAIEKKETLVTLVSDDGPTKVIPNSYISGIPSDMVVPYSRCVIVVDVGIFPDSVGLTDVKNDISNLVQASVGILPKVYVYSSKLDTKILYPQHVAYEAVREQVIGTHTSFYIGKLTAERELTAARLKIADYEAIFRNQ